MAALIVFLLLLIHVEFGHSMLQKPMIEIVKANQNDTEHDSKEVIPVQVPWQKKSKPRGLLHHCLREQPIRFLLMRSRFEKNREQIIKCQIQEAIKKLSLKELLIKDQPQKAVISNLHEACLFGDETLFTKLMLEKPKVNEPDANGSVPLHYVVGCPWFIKPSATANDIVKVDYEKQCAVRCRMIYALYRAGAKLAIIDKLGTTPMDLALEGAHESLVECLKKLASAKDLFDG